MASTRFSTSAANKTLATAAILKNGTGGGAPALLEDAGYPLSNLKVVDRYSLWKTGASAPNPTLVSWDLGSDLAITLVGVLNIRQALASAGNTLTVKIASRPAASGYSGTYTDYTERANYTVSWNGREVVDKCVVIASVSARYWMFRFNTIDTTLGMTLGKCVLGSADLDMGGSVLYSPGAENARIQPQVRNENLAGALVVTYTGTPYREFALPFRGITTTQKAVLDSVAAEVNPFIYLDGSDVATECVADPEHMVVHRWGPTDVWDVVLPLRGLP